MLGIQPENFLSINNPTRPPDLLTLRSRAIQSGVDSLADSVPLKLGPQYSASFQSHQHVVIIPDNDEPGRKHAEQVAATINGEVVKILELSGLPTKGDFSDWLAGKDRVTAVNPDGTLQGVTE